MKLLAKALSPVVHLIVWLYRIIAFVMSYGLLGLGWICLFATVLEFITVGISQESFAYIVTAVISFIVRWLVFQIAAVLYLLQEAIDIRANESFRDDYYEYG